MLTGRWFVEHDQRCCVTRAPVSVDGPVNTLTSAVVCLYRAERGWGGARGASGLGTRLETPLGRHGRGRVCYNQTRNESTVKSSGLSCTLRVPPPPSPAVTLVHS